LLGSGSLVSGCLVGWSGNEDIGGRGEKLGIFRILVFEISAGITQKLLYVFSAIA